MFRDLLIGVTNFYRDPESWKVLETEVIDRMIERKANDAPFRAWVPACASGEEAYTLAMIIFDRLARARRRLDVQVFATDINEEAIAVGRAGLYPAAIADDMPASALRAHFTREGDDYRVSKRLRETVVFATQNVISDPPFSKLDLVSCRNLMIYLEADIQQRLIELFHFALSENGFLFLGSSESADRPSGLFEAVSKTHRIYRRSAVTRVKQGSFPILPSRDRAAAGADMDRADGAQLVGAELARRVLLDRFAPASVLVNRRFEIQYYHGAVRNYLDFPSGEPTIELPVIAISELKSKLRSVLTRVLNEQQPAESLVRNVNRNGQEVTVRIAAEPVPHPGAGGPFILVFFEDASEPREPKQIEADRAKAMASAPEDETVMKQLQYELQATKEDLESTIEEMEASNEELKSSNEEVMSMNEELRSTNEELETSREELQSLNEELTTVNSQLEEKVQEVEAANNDLTNLLDLDRHRHPLPRPRSPHPALHSGDQGPAAHHRHRPQPLDRGFDAARQRPQTAQRRPPGAGQASTDGSGGARTPKGSISSGASCPTARPITKSRASSSPSPTSPCCARRPTAPPSARSSMKPSRSLGGRRFRAHRWTSFCSAPPPTSPAI